MNKEPTVFRSLSLKKMFEGAELGDEATTAAQVADAMRAAGGAMWLETCEPEHHNKVCFIRVVVSKVALEHQVRHEACQYREHVGMDPVGRHYREEAMTRLKSGMDEGALNPLRHLTRCVAKHYQETVIKCRPDALDDEFRTKITENFCGSEDVYWKHWENVEEKGGAQVMRDLTLT